MNILGEDRRVSQSIQYTPKQGTGTRSFQVARLTDKMGTSGVKPLVFWENDFWMLSDYGEIAEAIVEAKSRDWSTHFVTGEKLTKSLSPLKPQRWSDLRGRKFGSNEMVGAMVAVITLGGSRDFVISAAPNMLWVTGSSKWVQHIPSGNSNAGGQVHSEMIMAAQLEAFINDIGVSRTQIQIDVDIFIEKGSLCEGCSGTWEKLMKPNKGASPVTFRQL